MGRKRNESGYISKQYSQDPPITQEQWEENLIHLTYDRVEQRLRDGTASSQETVYFLKLGSRKEKLEKEKLEKEVELLRAKTSYLESQELTADKLQEVIDALRVYSGDRR